MRAQAAAENRVAVVEQVVGVIVAAVRGPRLGDVLRGLLRGDVLENDPQRREIAPQLQQVTVDEDGLAIEDIDFGSVTSPWIEQRHAVALAAASVHRKWRRSVTPASLFVVAPAGYNLTGDKAGLAGARAFRPPAWRR